MSQQTTQTQPSLDNAPEGRRIFNDQSFDSKLDSSRTLYSLLFPGSIDWFVLRQFILLLFIATLLVSVSYIIMDFLNSADVFIQKCHQYNVSFPVALYQYYMPRLLAMFDSLLTVCVILPSIILINQMIKRNETLALSCMGIRRVRGAYMIFIAAIGLVALFAWCREYVLPEQRSIIVCDMNSFFERDKAQVEPKTDPRTSVYITGESLDLAAGTIIKPVFTMPVRVLDQYGQTLSADVAIWQPAQLGTDAKPTREAGFLLKNVVAEYNLDDQGSLTLNGTTVLFTPLHDPLLHKGECFLVSGIEIRDLTINAELQEYCSIKELQWIMERMPPKQRTEAAILLHKRIARPFTDLCVIFVGMSFILANDNRFLRILLKAALWWGVAWIIINLSGSLASGADPILSPALAAWAPLIIFSAFAASVWDKVYY